MPYREIPTALVFAGINTPDHKSQFNEIANTVRQQSPSTQTNISNTRHHYVALLSSNTCNSLKNIMSTMIEQFMNHDDSALYNQNDSSSKIKSSNEHHIEEEEEAHGDDDANTGDQQDLESAAYQLGGTFVKTKPTKLPSHDLQLLAGWYMETVRRYGENKKLWPKLVIVLEDFESFDPILLQDFMTIVR